MSDRIRVLEPDGSAPPREPQRRKPPPAFRSLPVSAVAVGFGLLGILIGYLFGAARTSDAPPSLEAGGAVGVDHNYDPSVATPFGIPAPVADVEPAAPTTVAPTTTQPPPLGELVPGFDGTITWVDLQGRVYRWNDRNREARAIEVPIDSWGHSWSPGGGRVLYVSGHRRPALFAGVPGAEEPIALQAIMGMWHATDGNRLAWLGASDDADLTGRNAEAPVELWTAALSGSTHNVTTLESVDEYDGTEWYLLSWNADGFALLRNSWSNTSPEWQTSVVVLDASGNVRFEETDLSWLATRPDGSVVVAETRYNALQTDDDRNPRILALDGNSTPIAIESNVWTLAFSPDGRHVASISGGGKLRLDGPDGTVSFTRIAHEVTWSPDGRFLVAPLNDGRFLFFYDLETGEEHIVKTIGSAFNVQVH